jgi:hypothetical protein
MASVELFQAGAEYRSEDERRLPNRPAGRDLPNSSNKHYELFRLDQLDANQAKGRNTVG